MLTTKNSQLLAEKELGGWMSDSSSGDVTAIVQKYICEIEELRSKLFESESLCEQLRKDAARARRASASVSPAKVGWTAADQVIAQDNAFSVQGLIDTAKKELAKNKKEVRDFCSRESHESWDNYKSKIQVYSCLERNAKLSPFCSDFI